MYNLKLLTVLLSFFTCTIASYSQNPKVELPGTQVLKFKSAINNHDYELYIELPGSYSDTTKTYPVFYSLDGESEFPLVSSINGALCYEGYVPEMIIVGIGWQDDANNSRNRDFSAIAVAGDTNTGGAKQFLDVIKKEVITLVDGSFRSDKKNNTLYGGSLGGFFALYSLFHEPTLFNRYIVCSPALQWDGEITFKYEKDFAGKNRALNVKMLISSSQFEEELFTVSNYKKFISQIKASKYDGLQLESLVVAKMSHASEGAYAIGRGLQFVFSKPEFNVDNLILDKYAGKYEQDWVITHTGNNLYINMFGGKAKLVAETNESFYVKGAPVTCQFQKNANGRVIGYSLSFFSNKAVFFKKLN